MIRVLHNIGTLANGGMESFIMNLYRNIDRSLVQFDFVVGHRTDWSKAYENEILSLGGRIFVLEQGRNPFVQFYEILKKHPEYKIVHSHRNAISSLFLTIAKVRGVKIRISHVHSTSEIGIIKIVLTQLLCPLLNHVATNRLACGKEAAEHFFKNHNYEVFPNSIDLKKYRYDKHIRHNKRLEIGLSDSDVVIGHVGRFSVEKNHEFLVNVFMELHKIDKRSKLLLVGAGGLKKRIVQMVEEQKISDSVIFLENRADVHELLQVMDLAVFPSLYEGFSMAMVEMQASGLRILASTGVPDEINVTGSVFFMGLEKSPSQWAENVHTLLKYDREIMDQGQLYHAGLDIHSNAERLCHKYIELYNKAYCHE